MNTVNDKLEMTLNGMSELVHNEGATKKGLVAHAEKFIGTLIDSGELNTFDALGKVTKMQHFLEVVEKRLRGEATAELNHSKEQFVSGGITYQVREGAKRLQVDRDEVVQELKVKLKEREALLKTAQESGSPIYDSEGVEVPKVGYAFSADSIVIKY